MINLISAFFILVGFAGMFALRLDNDEWYGSNYPTKRVIACRVVFMIVSIAYGAATLVLLANQFFEIGLLAGILLALAGGLVMGFGPFIFSFIVDMLYSRESADYQHLDDGVDDDLDFGIDINAPDSGANPVGPSSSDASGIDPGEPVYRSASGVDIGGPVYQNTSGINPGSASRW